MIVSMEISSSTTSQMCSVGLRYGDSRGHLNTVKSCSWHVTLHVKQSVLWSYKEWSWSATTLRGYRPQDFPTSLLPRFPQTKSLFKLMNLVDTCQCLYLRLTVSVTHIHIQTDRQIQLLKSKLPL